MRKILITGSAGRIGQAISKRLRDRFEVLGLDQKPGPATTRLGNLLDRRALDDVLPGVDTVFHVAALHAPHRKTASDLRFRQVNVEGTEGLIAACLDHGIRRLVYTSTTSLYGKAMVAPDRAVWVNEALEPQPRDIYDETKIAAERLCEAAFEEGLETLALRVSRCFPENLRQMAVYRLYRGVDARDVAQAQELALDAALDGYEVFNVSARPPFSPDEMEALFNQPDEVLVRHYPWLRGAFRRRGWALPHRIDRVYAIDKVALRLGYVPEYNFESLFPGEGAPQSEA